MWWIGLLLGLIRFAPMIIGRTLFYGDNYSLLVPGRMFTAKWLARGIIPLWNPDILGGISWVGDINQSILYPATWLFLFLPPNWAVNVTIAGHWLITFLGMYRLVLKFHQHRWWAAIASVLWAFSTQMTVNTHNLATLQSLAWLPWVVYFGLEITKKSRAWMGFVLVVTAQFWGGYPQYVIFGVLAAIICSYLFKQPGLSLARWFKNWLFVGWVSICLAAALLFPFVETIFQSTRTTQTAEQAVIGSINPITWIEGLIPYFFDYPRLGVKWGPGWNGQPHTVIYLTWFGWLALIYIIGTKQNRTARNIWLWVITGLTTLFAMGSYLPGFAALYTQIPILNLGRYPAMWLILTNFLLCFQLGRLGPTLSISPSSYLKYSRLALALFLGFSLGLILWVWQANRIWIEIDGLLNNRLSQSLFHNLERDKILVRVILSNLMINSLLFGVAIKLWSKSRLKLLTGLLGLEMIINTQGTWFWGQADIFNPPAADNPKLMETISKFKSPQSRFLTRNMNRAYTDFSMYGEALHVRLPFSDSFIDANELSRHLVLKRMKNGLTPNWNMVEGIPIINGYTTLLPLNLTKSFPENDNRINFLGTIEPGSAKANQWSVGYYLIDKSFAVNEDLSGYEIIYEDEDYQIRQIKTALPRFRYEDGSLAAVTNLKETPNQIEFQLESPINQILTVADRYDPNWEVTVDGGAESLMNCAEQRCLVALEGKHSYRLYYRPLMFYLGLGLTIATASIMAGWSWYNRKKRNNE